MTRQELARLYRSGMPVNEIAQIAGTTVNAVNSRLTRLRRAGFDLEPRRERIQRLRCEAAWLLRMDFHLEDRA